MSLFSDLAAIKTDLAALRARVDALADPRLDGLVGRLFGAEAELRRVTSHGAAEAMRS